MSEASARQGIPIVIAAPSGTGKTTICRMLLERDPLLQLSISHTTRKMRPNDVDGVDYHFVTVPQFEALIEEGAFLEWASFSSNLYGTSLAAINARLDQGFDPLLEIEVQGAAQVRERREDACLIFLLPPSFVALEDRLKGRATDSDDEILRRLGEARGEIDRAAIFDFAVVNDELEAAVDELVALLASVRVQRGSGEPTPDDFERLERADCKRLLRDWSERQGL